MRSAELGRIVTPSRLHDSQVVVLRRRQGLNLDQAARALGITVLRLARLEAATRRLPTRTLRCIANVLTPSDRFAQISMFDLMGELEAAEANIFHPIQGEDAHG